MKIHDNLSALFLKLPQECLGCGIRKKAKITAAGHGKLNAAQIHGGRRDLPYASSGGVYHITPFADSGLLRALKPTVDTGVVLMPLFD
jgi:hypothetical protein